MVEIDGKDFVSPFVYIFILITLCYGYDLHQVHVCGRVKSQVSYFSTSSVHVYIQSVVNK